MTEESRLDSYFEALREDLPSSSDEARVRRRLAGAGVIVTLAATGKTAAAGSALGSAAAGSTVVGSAAAGSTVVGSAAAGSIAAAKLGLVSVWSIRFASLPLLAQLGVVTAGTTAVATGPIAVAVHAHRSSAATSQLIHEVRASVIERQSISAHVTAPPLVAAPPGSEQPPQQLSSPEVNPAERGNSRAPTRNVVPVESSARSGDTGITATESTPTVSANDAITSSTEREMASRGSADLPQNPEVDAKDAREPSIAPALRSESLDARNLSEETRLIDHALAAIRVGDLSLAARLLDEHAARFPHARLAREQRRVREKLNEARNHAEAP